MQLNVVVKLIETRSSKGAGPTMFWGRRAINSFGGSRLSGGVVGVLLFAAPNYKNVRQIDEVVSNFRWEHCSTRKRGES
jgi:hypothetical protein